MSKTRCSFCNGVVGKKYGMDLLGRIYCRRATCKIYSWFTKEITDRLGRLKKAW